MDDRLDRLVSPDEALAMVLRHARRLPPEEVALAAAHGRALAADLVADVDLPPFDAATMDGYAVIHDDDTHARTILGSGFAGDEASVTITRGAVAKIMTGAPTPPGATAVVPVENTTLRDGAVVIHQEHVRAGENIRPVGADLRRGDVLVRAGSELGPAEVGLLASLGHTRVLVGRRPRIAVISTGNEIVAPDATPGPGQIRDSNRFTLAAAAFQAGATVVIDRHIRDDSEALREGLRAAMTDCDAVVTSGGVSMGDRDLVKGLFGELAKVHFRRVFMKPGKPLNFATAGDTLLFGLPGNPVSSLVSFLLFVQPALRVMQGASPERYARAMVTLAHAVEPVDRIEYQRAIVTLDHAGDLVARNTGSQMSARLMSFVGANALLIIPPRATPYAAGERVQAIVLAPPAAS